MPHIQRKGRMPASITPKGSEAVHSLEGGATFLSLNCPATISLSSLEAKVTGQEHSPGNHTQTEVL